MGTRTYFFDVSFDARDHPHACGDKSITVADIVPYTGSSPRVWGQVVAKTVIKDQYRIIPTRVGTSIAF